MKPRPVGRPLLGAEPRKRYQVVLEPRVAEKLRKYGGGNLSAGIVKAANKVLVNPGANRG